MTRKSRVYVASSWRNQIQPAVVQALRDEGFAVYDFRHPADTFQTGRDGFSFAEIDSCYQMWDFRDYNAALVHPIAQEGFHLDQRAMQWADLCVLVGPAGRSSHLEAGWMKGAGKPVYILLTEPQEPELMYLLVDGVVDDLHNLTVRLRKYCGVFVEGEDHARV